MKMKIGKYVVFFTTQTEKIWENSARKSNIQQYLVGNHDQNTHSQRGL